MSVGIVTTTIHVPQLLRDYAANARQFGHQDLHFIVVGDKKTPPSVAEFCRQLEQDFNYSVQYMDIPLQLNFLEQYPALRDHLPYNSIQRRNIGILAAYKAGMETIITIDDDNLLLPNRDFIGQHRTVGTERSFECIESSSGWYNVCEQLLVEPSIPLFHRGFPLEKRWLPHTIQTRHQHGRVVVNAGLWLDAPDADALTWLANPVEVKSWKPLVEKSIGMAIGTWSPFNSQNTALAREIIPAYFLSPAIGRYDDIWASYIVKKITDHLGHFITFGQPMVRQERNPHNYWNDFRQEQFGMELTTEFVDALRALPLTADSYHKGLAEIAAWLPVFAANSKILADRPDYQSVWERYSQGIHIWQRIFEETPSTPLTSPQPKEIKINLGSGSRPIPGFINVDSRDIAGIEYPNTHVEDLSVFADESAHYVYASHVLEHIPREKTFATLCEWNRVLKPGGMLRIAVPDWDSLVKYYDQTKDLTNLLNFLFGGLEDDSNRHFRVFNYETLRVLLWEAGFKRIRRYSWQETDHADFDDFSHAYIPHLDSENGLLMSLNVECIKHMDIQQDRGNNERHTQALQARGW